ncbi:MAG: methyltransferase domain-containing protein [Patescibacteria group bacterium]
MSAAYDTYDYLSYWMGRDYEHNSEVIAIKDLISKIKKIDTILEIGAGFGRLVPSYSFRAKKVIITDPSSKLLKIARETNINKKKFKFIHSSLENLPSKIKNNSIDLIIMIRVTHHLKNLDLSFSIINKFLKSGGFVILEYPNKTNIKTMVKQFFKGNVTYLADISPVDLRSKRQVKKNTIPFFNYHPDKIKDTLESHGISILETRSVSNLRSSPIKNVLSVNTLLYLEKIFQTPFSWLSLGPSIFVLAKKRE